MYRRILVVSAFFILGLSGCKTSSTSGVKDDSPTPDDSAESAGQNGGSGPCQKATGAYTLVCKSDNPMDGFKSLGVVITNDTASVIGDSTPIAMTWYPYVQQQAANHGWCRFGQTQGDYVLLLSQAAYAGQGGTAFLDLVAGDRTDSAQYSCQALANGTTPAPNPANSAATIHWTDGNGTAQVVSAKDIANASNYVFGYVSDFRKGSPCYTGTPTDVVSNILNADNAFDHAGDESCSTFAQISGTSIKFKCAMSGSNSSYALTLSACH
jgi:hypothetical protein